MLYIYNASFCSASRNYYAHFIVLSVYYCNIVRSIACTHRFVDTLP